MFAIGSFVSLVSVAEGQGSRPLRSFPQESWIGPHSVNWPFRGDQVRLSSLSMESVFPSPMACPGAVFLGEDASWVFLAGSDGRGHGQVVVYERGVSGFRAAATASLAGRDIVGIAYSDAVNRLYMLDHVGQEVIWAPYQPGGALPTSWSVLVDANSEPLLGAIDFHELRLASDGAEPRLSVMDYRLLPGDQVDVRHLVSGAAEVESVLGPLNRAARLSCSSLAAGATSALVKGPPRTQVDVLRMDGSQPGQVVGSAVTDASGDAVVSVSPLEFGGIYGVTSAAWADPTGPFLATHTIDGVNDGLSDGYRIGPQLAHGGAFFRGNPLFVFPLQVTHDGVAAKPPGVEPLAVMLVLGAPGDQVVDLGDGRKALVGTVTIAEQVEVGEDSSPHGRADVAAQTVTVPTSIPDDPLLVGGVVLYQWYVILGPNDFRVSQITGLVVRDS